MRILEEEGKLIAGGKYSLNKMRKNDNNKTLTIIFLAS